MPGVQYPQQPQGWGPSLGAQQPQPPPGFGGMPGADVSATGMTWTPSADGGGLLWDGKSWNHAAASSTNPAQLIASTKADVADAVAVRPTILGARSACVSVRSRRNHVLGRPSVRAVLSSHGCHAVLRCLCEPTESCSLHGRRACTLNAAHARRASAAARAPTARTAIRSPRPASCATRPSCWALMATAAARPAAPMTRCAPSGREHARGHASALGALCGGWSMLQTDHTLQAWAACALTVRQLAW